MALPPIGGSNAAEEYIRQLAARNAPAARQALVRGVQATGQAIRSNPRIVQAIVRTSGSVALRAAGLSGVEASVAVYASERAVAVGAVAVGEIIVGVALVCFAVYIVYSLVSYWSSLPPEQRGYGKVGSINDVPSSELGQRLASSEYGEPARSGYRMLTGGGRPGWLTGVQI